MAYEGGEKLRQVMIKLFGFDPAVPLKVKKFDWPWKSKKPVIRVYSESGEKVDERPTSS